MSLGVQDLPADARYEIFEALSHPTRVKILELVQEKQLSFSQLKRELGVESSGQLQHHLLKLSGLVEVETKSGCYVLTGTGRRALDIYALSRASGTPLEAVCCLPVRGATTPAMRVGRTGTALRLSFAVILLAVTATYFSLGEPSLRFGSAVSIGAGPGAVIAGFFGISFLIAGMERTPGCEVTAIPNLFVKGRKYYCDCVIRPFNLPDGRLLEPVRSSDGVTGGRRSSSEKTTSPARASIHRGRAGTWLFSSTILNISRVRADLAFPFSSSHNLFDRAAVLVCHQTCGVGSIIAAKRNLPA